jgi:prevent-host-death family protein
MQTANIATAKNELSRLLRRVKRGERVIITDRNRPVAQLAPLSTATGQLFPDDLLALHEAGLLTPPAGSALDLKSFLAVPSPSLPKNKSLTAAVLADREEGR